MYRKDKGEGVRELDQAMNEVAAGYGVYGLAGVGGWRAGWGGGG